MTHHQHGLHCAANNSAKYPSALAATKIISAAATFGSNTANSFASGGVNNNKRRQSSWNTAECSPISAVIQYLGVLGRGTFGQVSMARVVHGQRRGEIVAVKRVRLSTRPDECDRAWQEVRALHTFHHDNIVSLRFAFIVLGVLHIGLELAEAGSLTDVLDTVRRHGRSMCLHGLLIANGSGSTGVDINGTSCNRGTSVSNNNSEKIVNSSRSRSSGGRNEFDNGKRRHGLLSRREVLHIARDALNGLAYMHSMGVLHRDIKSANLLLTRKGVIKVADLGCTLVLSNSRKQKKWSRIGSDCGGGGTMSKTPPRPRGIEKVHGQRNAGDFRHRSIRVVGTPYWMPPECIHFTCPSGGRIARHTNAYSPAADIWSLGVTLLEATNGEPPTARLTTMAASLAAIKRGPPGRVACRQYWGPAVCTLIELCVQQVPSHRPSARDILRHPVLQMSTAQTESSCNSQHAAHQRTSHSNVLLQLASFVISARGATIATTTTERGSLALDQPDTMPPRAQQPSPQFVPTTITKLAPSPNSAKRRHKHGIISGTRWFDAAEVLSARTSHLDQ